MSKKTVIYLFVFLALLVIAYLGFSLYVASRLVAPPKTTIDISPAIISKNFEDVEFDTGDGLKLKGWLFSGTNSRLVILVSGLRNSRVNTDYLGFLIAKELVDKDYSVLMYDSRATGESEGEKLTWGLTESRDVVASVEFAQSRGFARQKVGIIGDSLGAISVLMAASELNGVGALVIDTAAANFKPIVSDRLKIEEGVPKFTHPAVFFFAKAAFGVDFTQIKPVDRVGKIKNTPILFIHAAGDETIPAADSRELADTVGTSAKLVIFPEGAHIETYKKNPQLYRKEVFGFLDKYLGSK